MKKITSVLLAFLLICCFSCSPKNDIGSPLVSPEKITSTVMNWVVYQRKYIKLYDNFTAYDTTSKKMDRGDFIRLISEGKHFPVALSSKDSLPHYKLYSFSKSVDRGIKAQIKDYGKTSYRYYAMEGKPLPRFDYVDINGNVYNSETTKHKIIVVKCWFIGCKACELEMPELNKMVEKYKRRKDILFVSVAPNNKKELEKFLTRRKFDYAVVGEKREYILDELKIWAFPTHILIDKDGLVKTVVNSAEELIPMVGKITGESIASNK